MDIPKDTITICFYSNYTHFEKAIILPDTDENFKAINNLKKEWRKQSQSNTVHIKLAEDK